MENPLSRLLPELQGYHFDLPEQLIARYPTARRSNSRLMVVQTTPQFTIEDRRFFELTKFLRAKDLLMLNTTAVSRRRVYLKRKSGARLEALFLEHRPDGSWNCLVKGRGKLRPAERLTALPPFSTPTPCSVEFLFSDQYDFPGNCSLRPVIAGGDSSAEIPAWQDRETAERWFADHGAMPIPPYLKRRAEKVDNSRYQTVYAQKAMSVAAPTAGLHFSPSLLTAIGKQGVEIEKLQLHIGYATFAPLTSENFLHNRLHPENYFVDRQTADRLNRSRGRIIAAGTTTLRALEDNFRRGRGKFQGGSFTTELFLKPPDKPRSLQGLLTNFHLPASSLLLLVASILGREQLLSLYQYAIGKGYRFYSYGDAMLILF